MARGRQAERQGDLMLTWSEMPRSPGHVFYDRLQQVLVDAGFDGFVEDACKAYYAKTMGAPSIPPGRYFRMHMVGYFEGIDSEHGPERRCAALTACPCGSSSASASAIRCLTVPGRRAPGAACHLRCMMPCSPGFCSGWPIMA